MSPKRGRRKTARDDVPRDRGRIPVSALVLFLFFLSGALGLIYEVVWLRMLILIFGSTHFASRRC
jgi:hypothetical protein